MIRVQIFKFVVFQKNLSLPKKLKITMFYILYYIIWLNLLLNHKKYKFTKLLFLKKI